MGCAQELELALAGVPDAALPTAEGRTTRFWLSLETLVGLVGDALVMRGGGYVHYIKHGGNAAVKRVRAGGVGAWALTVRCAWEEVGGRAVRAVRQRSAALHRFASHKVRSRAARCRSSPPARCRARVSILAAATASLCSRRLLPAHWRLRAR